MEELKYIPGDLVIINDKLCSIEYIFMDDEYGLQDMDGYIHFANVTEIKPISIIPTILEANRWETQNKWYYFLSINKYSIRYIGIDFEHKSPKGNLYVEINNDNVAEIQYCHQLQHLLFGLNLNSELKI